MRKQLQPPPAHLEESDGPGTAKSSNFSCCPPCATFLGGKLNSLTSRSFSLPVELGIQCGYGLWGDLRLPPTQIGGSVLIPVAQAQGQRSSLERLQFALRILRSFEGRTDGYGHLARYHCKAAAVLLRSFVA